MSNNNNQRKGNSSRRNSRAAERELRRNHDDANRQAGFDDTVTDADKARLQMNQRKANQLNNGKPVLRVIPLGGQADIGEKNMTIIEYGNDAIVIDTGFSLGIDLPGINYSIPDITYLESIKHKVRGYVYTHGHLDHIGAAPYILPKVPAPIYGSRFSIAMVEKQLADSDAEIDFKPESVIMNIDNHERLKIGPFFVELMRVTHNIPDSTAVLVDTPEGRILHSGDFRLDPEPLDHLMSDLPRLTQAGEDGVMLLMLESTDTERPGRTPTEHTLEQSFHDLLHQSTGRVIVSSFSSNINRVQMVVNAAVESGRKIALDGRSLLATVDLAVKLGYVKIPKGTLLAMRDIASRPDNEIAIVCTGSQGEPNSALQRMAFGSHNHIKVKENDTVIFSSSVIPGNERSIVEIVDDLMRRGAKVYRHNSHELDGCGPLHVSGHGSRDEYKQMIEMTKPTYIMPNHGHYPNRYRHVSIAGEMGITADKVALIDNGDILEFSDGKMTKNGSVPSGSVLVDQSGAVVPNLVVKDRLLMSGDGIVVVVLTIDKQTKRFLSSPDVITRGLIHVQEQMDLIDQLRDRVREFTKQHIKNSDLKSFKLDLRDDISGFLYQELQHAPMVIPVVNMVNSSDAKNNSGQNRRRNQSNHPNPNQPTSGHGPISPKA